MARLYINGEWYCEGSWEECWDIANRRAADPECANEEYEVITTEE